MSKIWLSMLLAGMIACFMKQDLKAVESVFMNVGKDTLDFVVPLMCNIVFFNGVLEIAKQANILNFIARLMKPILKRIFKMKMI